MTKAAVTPYRNYKITYNPKPIPDRRHDWDFVHIDYDGPPDHRCGTSSSYEQAKRDIDLLEIDWSGASNDV